MKHYKIKICISAGHNIYFKVNYHRDDRVQCKSKSAGHIIFLHDATHNLNSHLYMIGYTIKMRLFAGSNISSALYLITVQLSKGQ